MEEPSEEPSAEPMLTRNALTALLPTLALGWPANDTSCHTGRGLIYGVHFSGLEIETVPAKDYGECCAACGAQQTSPKQSQELCDWIEWNPSIPQPRCTLKTGEGNVAGQHNGIISGAHGEETVQHFACSTSYTCAPVPNGTPHPKNQTQAVCEASCVAPPTTFACDLSSGVGICAAAKPGHATNMTKANCDAACVAPVPPPPPPLATNPCLRFGHTVPVDRHVDAEIVQMKDGKKISHTWPNYKFGDFSDWVNVFKPGSGTISLWENVAVKRVG